MKLVVGSSHLDFLDDSAVRIDERKLMALRPGLIRGVVVQGQRPPDDLLFRRVRVGRQLIQLPIGFL